MIQTVYFDLGNVLLFFSLEKMIRQLSACVGLEPKEVYTHLFETNLRERYEKGQIDTHGLHLLFQEKAKRPFTLPDFTLAFSNIFTLNQELVPLIEKLKANKIQLILLSNTSPCHFEYALKHYPILQLFDHKVLSYEVGAWKPERKIFDTALQLARGKPQECFYTDDIPEFIESASLAGLPGAVFTDAETLKIELVQRGLLFV